MVKKAGGNCSTIKKAGNWIIEHIRKAEWLSINNNVGFYNGYYDNDGQRVEGESSSGMSIWLQLN